MEATLFDISGRVSLAANGLSPQAAAYLEAQMDPYRPLRRPLNDASDIVLETVEGLKPSRFGELAGDAGDGLVTGWDGRRLGVIHEGRVCLLPAGLEAKPLVFSFDVGFPLWRIFGSVVRPALMVGALRHGVAAVHASAVEVDGGGVLIAGWSESGKTETALALAERGARFVSDKWTLVSREGALAPFPAPVGVRGWVLPHLPRLRRQLPARSRTQTRAASLLSRMAGATSGLERGPIGSVVHDALGRAIAMGARASIRPSQINAVYRGDGGGDRELPLHTAVLLTTATVGEPSVLEIEPRSMAQRLMRSAAFERRAAAQLVARRGYLAEEPAPSDSLCRSECEMVEAALRGGVRLLEIRSRFPADPHGVARALERSW